MLICVLVSANDTSASPFAPLDPYMNPKPWLPDDEVDTLYLQKATYIQQLRDAMHKKRYDVFINLCDGGWDEDRAGIEVIDALERFNVPYTGAGRKAYDPSKETMKMVAYYAGVPTAPYGVAYVEEDIDIVAETLKDQYPLIVKAPAGYSSIGMTPKSRVENVEELREQASIMINKYDGALVEAFVEGREFTVLAVEDPEHPEKPHCCVPMECIFPPGESFKHFEMKWVSHGGITWVPVTEPELAESLKDMTAKLFVGLQGESFGRADFRMRVADGQCFMLEMNANCGIFYPPWNPGSADFILMNDPLKHEGFLDLMIRSALAKHQRKQVSFTSRVAFHPVRGYGLAAVRDLREGEVILPPSNMPHVLTPMPAIVERKGKGDGAAREAWPVNADEAATWGDDQTTWRPLRHSCAPTAWISKGNLTARVDIPRGGEITIDHATVSDNQNGPCQCGAPTCRKQLTPKDHLLPAVGAYGDAHLSGYVLALRRAAGSA